MIQASLSYKEPELESDVKKQTEESDISSNFENLSERERNILKFFKTAVNLYEKYRDGDSFEEDLEKLEQNDLAKHLSNRKVEPEEYEITQEYMEKLK